MVRNEQILLIPQCFLTFWITFSHVLSNFKLSSANSFSFEGSKMCCLEKELILEKKEEVPWGKKGEGKISS